ncbi:hypothetical protein PTKU46_85460 [Paraburkholderia terrae]|nr:hypothetical protein PTKU15_79590 [Paraburkholderia terrae]
MRRDAEHSFRRQLYRNRQVRARMRQYDSHSDIAGLVRAMTEAFTRSSVIKPDVGLPPRLGSTIAVLTGDSHTVSGARN